MLAEAKCFCVDMDGASSGMKAPRPPKTHVHQRATPIRSSMPVLPAPAHGARFDCMPQALLASPSSFWLQLFDMAQSSVLSSSSLCAQTMLPTKMRSIREPDAHNTNTRDLIMEVLVSTSLHEQMFHSPSKRLRWPRKWQWKVKYLSLLFLI